MKTKKLTEYRQYTRCYEHVLADTKENRKPRWKLNRFVHRVHVAEYGLFPILKDITVSVDVKTFFINATYRELRNGLIKTHFSSYHIKTNLKRLCDLRMKEVFESIKQTSDLFEDYTTLRWVKWIVRKPTHNGTVYMRFNGKNTGEGEVFDGKLLKLEGLSNSEFPKYEDTFYWLEEIIHFKDFGKGK